jgi:hypothetical protein
MAQLICKMSAHPFAILNEGQAISLIIRHLETQFPKVCGTCERRFSTLRDFIGHTAPVGDLVCYTLDGTTDGADDPMGAVALSNCGCGSTLALTTTGMSPADFQTLFHWVRSESKFRGVPVEDYLQYVRQQTRRRISLMPATPADYRDRQRPASGQP